ncbi:MAG: hypothetical protein GF350_05040 [Chitinivibrionales bacterium]|nr:hypothetical protein [Chitinivibrionales bacterium]
MTACFSLNRHHLIMVMMLVLYGALCRQSFAVNYTHGPTGNSDAILDAHELMTGWDYNHNTSTVTLDNGDVLMYWVCLNENSGEAGQFCRATYSKSEKKWSDPETIDKTFWGGNGRWANVCLFNPRKPGAPLLMFYSDGFTRVGKSYVKTSTDNGETWSDRYVFPADVFDGEHGTWPAGPLEIAGDAQNAGYSAWSLLKSANKEFNGGMYIIPGNNYTGVEPGGDAWGINMFRTGDFYAGMVYGFLVPDPDDWSEIVAVVRKYDKGNAFYLARSHDGGVNWDSSIDKLSLQGGGGVHSGGFAVSLDLHGGPLRDKAWQITVGDEGNRQYLRVVGTQDVDVSWQKLLELDIGDGEAA